MTMSVAQVSKKMQKAETEQRAGLKLRGAVLSFMVALMLVSLAPSMAEARQAGRGFADLAEKLMPAVVNISTSQTVERRSTGPSGPFNDFFEEFFRNRPGQPSPPTPQPQPRQRKVSSLGSGFVIDPDGIIITNNHVIEEADKITVNFSDGSKYDAEILGRDPKTDLAVLKIDAPRAVPYVRLGDSEKARVGDWVIAIGNPFGLGGSLSAGIISAINRDINAGPYDSFIQTDAAINRGNSGGPLFNMQGEVIGVNSAIISPSGGSVGIGFSIPSNLTKTVVSQLRQYGETRRGWLGVRIQSVTDELAESLGLDDAGGALVSEVSPGGPAERGGILRGDVITRFDGKPVPNMRDLPRIVAETDIDKPVLVEVLRRGSRKTLKIVTGRLDEPQLASSKPVDSQPEVKGDETEIMGLVLRNLTPDSRAEFGILKDAQGALVVSVDGDAPAVDSGIRRGDLISEIDQQQVTNVAEAVAALKKAKAEGRKSSLILLNSRDTIRFVALRLK